MLWLGVALASTSIVSAQTLNLPPRAANAPSGSEFVKIITPLSLDDRENMIYGQIIQGNVPNWLRTMVPVTTNATINSVSHTITYYVTPDYLAVGNDTDYFLEPMTPLLAQRLANAMNCSLPTRKMVNDIWKKAPCHLAPSTISPGPEMTTVPVFDQHNTTVHNQRFAVTNTYPLGTLTGGDKKDVVIATKIYTNLQTGVPKPVCIYGWHQTDGSAIQPLYNGHEETYADYSHGIRFVQMNCTVDGVANTITNVLKTSTLAALLSDEATFSGNTLPTPRYTLPAYAPVILTSPYSQFAKPGTNVTLRTLAIGDAPLSYQWKFNGANLAGATTSLLNLNNVQSGNAGDYTVVVNNASGSTTSLAATLTIDSVSYPLLFSDAFETNSAALWNLFQGSDNGASDFTTNWAFNYGAVSYTFNGETYLIPPAPNSGGTTRGVKFSVNNNDTTAAAAGVNIYPKTFSASGNFALRFDLWLNYPGGIGGAGSTGSTEYAIFGINHAGTRANWGATSPSATDGLWFGVDGEGGTSRDYRAYVGNLSGVQTELIGAAASGLAESNNAVGIYPTLLPGSKFETAGSPGKRWVSGEVSQVNNVITWKLDGTVIAVRTNSTSFTSGDVMIGFMDIFSSIASPASDAFALFDNVRVLNLNAPVYAPSISTQPQSQSALAGDTVTFSVGVSGTAPFNYQWQLNGVNVSGATSSSLVLNNVQLGDAGNYSALVSNTAGSVTSANATLSVTSSGTAPSITQQPSGQMVDAGDSVTFHVVASGSAPLTYQWRLDGVTIPGATTSSYTIDVVQANDAGDYTVLITNNWGTVLSSTATLVVNTPPVFTLQPQSQTVVAGANATFSASAAGTGPMTYQWRLNGLNIAGATATIYTRNNVQSTDTGMISVTASNGVGVTVSSEASLALTGFAVFNETFEAGSMSNWTILTGNSALTISTAQNHTGGGSKSAVVTNSLNKMYHNLGLELENRTRLTFWLYDEMGTQHRLYSEVRSYSGAGYPNGTLLQLAAAGRYGAPFGTGTGTLAGEAVNTAKYQGRIVSGSNTGWFNLNATRTTGWHKFEIERAADGTTVNFYVDNTFDRAITATTYAPWDSVTIGSVGASGTSGNGWFDDVTMESVNPPVITTQPSSQSVSAGATATFSVVASGNVTGYQWRKDGINIPGATNANLVLNNIQSSDVGTYTVVVRNGVGPTVSTAATLTVN